MLIVGRRNFLFSEPALGSTARVSAPPAAGAGKVAESRSLTRRLFAVSQSVICQTESVVNRNVQIAAAEINFSASFHTEYEL